MAATDVNIFQSVKSSLEIADNHALLLSIVFSRAMMGSPCLPPPALECNSAGQLERGTLKVPRVSSICGPLLVLMARSL